MARLVDTSVFVELERRRHSLSALNRFTGGEDVALASITASELLVGVHRSTSEPQRTRRLRFVNSVLHEVPVLPFDLATAEVHAKLLAELASRGRIIGPNDLIIAATALTHGYDVLTQNLRHFTLVHGLTVDGPSW
jgi:predicted nucleic acid-binding protein